MLRADDLEFAYQATDLSYLFSFEAEAGMVTAVSGASGSGKSTLLDLIAGFILPRSGSLRLDGADLVSMRPEKRPVSLLLQSDNLFDHLTAFDNAALGLANQRREKNKVMEALAEVGLAGFEKQVAGTLSGGQKQRVALARTLLRAKPVLLLDEPFSALDDETRQAMRELIGALTRQQGWHTILVSHHADDIAALAGRHYRIVSGRLERL
jgi:thiamine transport system ATP-binding protein